MVFYLCVPSEGAIPIDRFFFNGVSRFFYILIKLQNNMPIISSPIYGIGVVVAAVGTVLWAYTHRSSADRSSVGEHGDSSKKLFPPTATDQQLRERSKYIFPTGKELKDSAKNLEVSGKAALEELKKESKLFIKKEENLQQSLIDRLSSSSSSPPSESKGLFSRLIRPFGFSSSSLSPPPVVGGAYDSSNPLDLPSVDYFDVMEEDVINKRTAAEKVGAETAATLAAATSFSEKVAEDQLIVQRLTKEVQLMKEAYLMKLNEAQEAQKLMKKDEMYRRDTERKSTELIKQEDYLLREAARSQELLENKKLLAEHTKKNMVDQKYKEADALRRQAEAERLRALQAYANEQEQVELARKRMNDIDQRTLPTMTAEEANRRARELQNEENELSRRITAIDHERRNAIEQAKIANDIMNKRSRESLDAEKTVQAHEQALRNIAERMKSNEIQIQTAVENMKRYENTLPSTELPLKSNPVVAEATAEGEAHVQRAYDSTHSQGSSLGTTVVAKGKAIVHFRNATNDSPGPRGGFDSIQINREIISNNDTKANITLKESSRNEPHRRLYDDNDNTMNDLLSTPSSVHE